METDWGDQFPVDVPPDQAEAAEYDALLLPGGVINPDKLRMLPAPRGWTRNWWSMEIWSPAANRTIFPLSIAGMTEVFSVALQAA